MLLNIFCNLQKVSIFVMGKVKVTAKGGKRRSASKPIRIKAGKLVMRPHINKDGNKPR